MTQKHDESHSKKQAETAETPKPATELKGDAAKVKELNEQMLRLRADFDNTKKRLEKDRMDAVKFANEKLLTEILQAVDNFDRAMTFLEGNADPQKVKQGLQLAQGELHKVLEQHGVEVIKSVGQEFDPQWHEAVGAVQNAPGVKDGHVVDEMQKGYKLNGRLIRPSRVRVAQNS